VYADVSGTIALKAGGLVPLRPNWDGLLPVPGDGRYEWAGFHALEDLPMQLNPERGWVASANEMNLPPGYAHRVGFEWATSFRFQRIAEVLEQSPQATVEDMARLQADHVSLMARRLVALVAGLSSEDPKTRQALELLKAWDHVEGRDSAAAFLYEVWIRYHLGATLVSRVASKEASAAVVLGDFRSVIALLEHPDARLGEDPAAARDELLRASLAQAMDQAAALQGPDPSTWAWGRSHQALLEHPLSPLVPPQERARLNAGPVPRGGAHDTVGNTGYGFRDFRQIAGSSFRLVVDVGDWDRSLAMNSPGQSGDPASPHYKDLFESWARDESFPLLYSRDRIEKASEQRIRLEPLGAARSRR
jgi:penicillin G amidase